ncbi:MAG: SDR family oxidoreductase [Alphaproteobacteria bacterium]|nr:SDR family oxidoreductase [Alphaproteobacteria bacterium]
MTEARLAALPTVFRPGLFAGKTVLVSGAGSGLGRAIALLFARLGADLVICGRDGARLAQAERLFRRQGVDVLSRAMTIRDPAAVHGLIDAAWDRFGGLDVVVNNAGGQFPQMALDYTVKGWQAVIDTNLNGTWHMMQAAARRWVKAKRGGNIINIVSDIWRGQPGIAHTCAARAGVIYLSKSVAVEWTPHAIRVNCVAPGCVETTAFALYPDAGSRTFYESNPMHRAGDVQDVAEACCYLAADSGKFVTGEVITIDGGQQMWGDPWPTGRPAYFDLSRGPNRKR